MPDDGNAPNAANARRLKVAEPDAWRRNLIFTNDGKHKKCLANVMAILAADPAWLGVLAYDAFAQTVVATRVPPARDIDAPAHRVPGDWTDADSTRAAAWIATTYGFEPTVVQVEQAVQSVAQRTIVHPVREYLSALVWDDVPRLNYFASTYLGAPDTQYSAAVGSRWLIGAVARVFEPGCKVDSMLVLEGAQGIGKSSALRTLAGGDWFADTGITIGEKDSYQALRRKWIFELAELSAIRGARDIERVKNFLSSQVDTYRASYGRRTQDHARQVVFAGSTNELQYLSDPTGSRRFWPITCRHVDLATLKRDRDQLWAEARARFDRGEAWHLDTPELRAAATAEQSNREERDDWIEIIAHWLTTPIQLGKLDDGVTTAEVLLTALNFPPERIKNADTQRVGRALRALRYERRQVRSHSGERAYRYFPPSDPVTDSVTPDDP